MIVVFDVDEEVVKQRMECDEDHIKTCLRFAVDSLIQSHFRDNPDIRGEVFTEGEKSCSL